ncbi:hypothetical protein B6U98_05025 [Thermoplasmatales archaeon ex4572_165]|nr:MAG: hypothetical protein B6U98_05025 [Thermoplasmatales archaeon ex4572_165]
MKKKSSFLIITLIILVMILPIVTANFNNEIPTNNFRKNSIFEKMTGGSIMDNFVEFLKNFPFINKTINSIRNIFGLVEDSSDDQEDGINYEPFYQSDTNDPKSSKPTDTSISVTIEDFDITYTTTDDDFEFDVSFNGRTTGNVYACYWIIVSYFNDGTCSYYNMWNGPNQKEIELSDTSFGLTFFGKGPGGYSDWSRFQGHQYMKGKIGDQDEIPVEIDKTPVESEEITLDIYVVDTLLYVRAFSDKELTQWNQDSISLFDELSESMYNTPQRNQGDGPGKGTPGFEVLTLIASLGIVIIFIRKRK